jgi:hypothetical protein
VKVVTFEDAEHGYHGIASRGDPAVFATGPVLTFVLGESAERDDDRARVGAGCDNNDCTVMVRGGF